MSDPRRPGRPRIADEEAPARVHVTLPPDQYDRVLREAERQHLSVPEVIRRNLRLPDESDD